MFFMLKMPPNFKILTFQNIYKSKKIILSSLCVIIGAFQQNVDFVFFIYINHKKKFCEKNFLKVLAIIYENKKISFI